MYFLFSLQDAKNKRDELLDASFYRLKISSTSRIKLTIHVERCQNSWSLLFLWTPECLWLWSLYILLYTIDEAASVVKFEQTPPEIWLFLLD